MPMSGEDAAVFMGREIKGALAGRRITNDVNGRKKLLEGAHEKGWEIWLPNGKGLSLGDSCTVCSPSDWCIVAPISSLSNPCRRLNSSLRPPALRTPNLLTAFSGRRLSGWRRQASTLRRM